MWTKITRPKYERAGQRYASDLTDAEWAVIESHLPAPKPLGRPRGTDLRAVVDAILYMARSGCQWRLLPKDFPPFTTVQGYFYDWRDSGLFVPGEDIHMGGPSRFLCPYYPRCIEPSSSRGNVENARAALPGRLQCRLFHGVPRLPRGRLLQFEPSADFVLEVPTGPIVADMSPSASRQICISIMATLLSNALRY